MRKYLELRSSRVKPQQTFCQGAYNWVDPLHLEGKTREWGAKGRLPWIEVRATGQPRLLKVSRQSGSY